MRLYTSELVKKYKARTVVDHVSIDVNQGEIVGLLGPNGAGKTTTFYMIVGLIKPNEGRIFLESDEGQASELTDLPVYRRAQLGVGYLAQEASVFRRLSVEDNIRAVLEMTSFSKEYQNERVEALIEEFRLQKVRKSLGIQLSGGERRRTEIARAVAINPAFILLDEPFSALDSYLKWNLELELSDLLAGFRGPILWVSHELGGSGTPFRILRIIPDAGHAILLLQPEGAAEGSPVLRAECDAAGTYAAGQTLPVSFREEKLLFFWGAGQNFRILL